MSPHLPPPDLDAALTTAGALCHFVASDPARADEFARWIEHCAGDLDGRFIIGYLSAVHDVLAPSCPIPADMPGRLT